MKRQITTMLLSAALLTVACSDNGPTGPSPAPEPDPGTPPTTTPPGGNNGVPQVAGTYRGQAIDQHVPPGGGGRGPTIIPGDACTDVEQDGTMVTIEVPIDPWEIRGTITPSGRVENVKVLEEDKRTLHMESVLFDGESLRVELSTAPTGSAHRFLLDLDVERQPAPAEKCDRTGQTARPGNQG